MIFAIRRGFTLIELLVVISIIVLLMGILLPALAGASRAGKAMKCMAQMRQIGLATVIYADDHGGRLPRSAHSAMAFREMPWGFALRPYLGACACEGYSVKSMATDGEGPTWQTLFNGLYRCPMDRRRDKQWSYGKNVYPELTSEETGGPTWTHIHRIPRPVATILYGELRNHSSCDHFMSHFWSAGGEPDVDAARHGQRSNYVFVDGHVAAARFPETFEPSKHLDNWNPATAQ